MHVSGERSNMLKRKGTKLIRSKFPLFFFQSQRRKKQEKKKEDFGKTSRDPKTETYQKLLRTDCL